MRLPNSFPLLTFLLAVSSAAAFEVSLERGGKSVVITPDKPTDVIRYTLNGKDPDVSAGVYLAPVELTEGGTLKAARFEGNQLVDKVVSRVVVGAGPKNTALVPLTQNRDWRSYDWVSRHEEVLALNKPGAVDAGVVLLGDSITHFWAGEPRAKRVSGREAWDRWLAPHRPLNLGFGWDRTENVLWRLRNGEIAGLAPAAFVVLIGTNNLSGFNSPEETAEGVLEICREIRRQKPRAKILLLGILPRQAKPDATRQRVTETNQILKAAAGGVADAYLDLTERLVETDGSILKETMNDYLHPTNKGYEVLGAAIDAQLKEWAR